MLLNAFYESGKIKFHGFPQIRYGESTFTKNKSFSISIYYSLCVFKARIHCLFFEIKLNE